MTYKSVVRAARNLSLTLCPAKSWRRAALVFAVLAVFPRDVCADSSDEPAFSSPESVTWARSIGGLGFRNGLTSRGFTDTLEAYFTVPPSARAATGRLTVKLEALAPDGVEGFAEILLNGKGRASLPLTAGLQHVTTVLPVEPTLLADGHLTLAVSYRGAISDNRCADERLGELSLTLLPDSALAVPVAKEAFTRPDSAWEVLPERVTLFLPRPPLSPAEYETALKLAVALERWGHEVTFAVDETTPTSGAGAIVLTRKTARKSTIVAGLQDSAAVLSFASDGENPEESAHLERWLQGTARTLPLLAARIPIEMLGSESGTRAAAPKAAWSIPLSLGRLPPGMFPDRLSLALATPADIEASTHLLHVFIDGMLIASRRLRPTGAMHRVTIPIPGNELGVNSRARIVFERVEANPACQAPQRALPVALLPDSTLALRQSGSSHNFAGLVPQFAHGLALSLPRRFLSTPQATLPLVTSVARDFVRPPWQVELRFLEDGSSPAPTSAFIAIGPNPPRGATLPLALDRGAISIVDRTNIAIVSLKEDDGDTLAQVIEARGLPGLWIRPAFAMLPQSPGATKLARGNVALMDSAGVALWLDTRAERGLIVRYADSSLVAARLAHIWAWAIGGAWLLLTIIVLRQTGARRKDKW